MATRKAKEQTPEEKRLMEEHTKAFEEGYSDGMGDGERQANERMLVGFIFACQERGYSDEQTLEFWNRLAELAEQHATSPSASVEIIKAFRARIANGRKG